MNLICSALSGRADFCSLKMMLIERQAGSRAEVSHQKTSSRALALFLELPRRPRLRRVCYEPPSPPLGPMKKLILWDIDGTIIVSHGAGVRAMEKALTQRFGKIGDLTQIDWAGRTDTWITGEVFGYT